MTKLDEFICLNAIDPDELSSGLYEGIFCFYLSHICNLIKRFRPVEQEIRRGYRTAADDISYTGALLKKYCRAVLPQKETRRMSECIKANLRRQKGRREISEFTYNRLIKQQNGQCACCGKKLSGLRRDNHVDHIIPWELVGDGLAGNLQLLCSDCNLTKSSQTDFMLKSVLLHIHGNDRGGEK